MPFPIRTVLLVQAPGVDLPETTHPTPCDGCRAEVPPGRPTVVVRNRTGAPGLRTAVLCRRCTVEVDVAIDLTDPAEVREVAVRPR